MGFFISPIEALPEITVTDIYFTHQRGTYMGIYSFTLAGSKSMSIPDLHNEQQLIQTPRTGNYFAPVICGFIAERQGWQWVFYWPAIFLGFTFIFLFFFMEESNYNRKTTGIVTAPETPPAGVGTDLGDHEKAHPVTSQSMASIEAGTASKSYAQKLSVWQPMPGQNMFERAKRSLQYLSWPVIAYCGFSYGSYLILCT